jgi:hypothetical protein
MQAELIANYPRSKNYNPKTKLDELMKIKINNEK